eukprot:COSAG01_NODE_15775_length_1300_cov_17.095754_1_plen_314_part_01
MGMFSKGRELRYHSGKKRFALGSYDEADHPLVVAEFHKDRKRFFDDEEFWRYDMRYKLAVQKRLPLPAPFVRTIQSRHKGVCYDMGGAVWQANITLYGVQIRLGSWFTVGTKEERRTKDATPDGRAELDARDAYCTAIAAPEQCWAQHLQSCSTDAEWLVLVLKKQIYTRKAAGDADAVSAAKVVLAAAAAAAKQQKEQKKKAAAVVAKQQKEHKKKAAAAAKAEKKRKAKECAEERKCKQQKTADPVQVNNYLSVQEAFASGQVQPHSGGCDASGPAAEVSQAYAGRKDVQSGHCAVVVSVDTTLSTHIHIVQ